MLGGAQPGSVVWLTGGLIDAHFTKPDSSPRAQPVGDSCGSGPGAQGVYPGPADPDHAHAPVWLRMSATTPLQ